MTGGVIRRPHLLLGGHRTLYVVPTCMVCDPGTNPTHYLFLMHLHVFIFQTLVILHGLKNSKNIMPSAEEDNKPFASSRHGC
jgi:hypothetical protein